jgi:hypothetical protein
MVTFHRNVVDWATDTLLLLAIAVVGMLTVAHVIWEVARVDP